MVLTDVFGAPGFVLARRARQEQSPQERRSRRGANRDLSKAELVEQLAQRTAGVQVEVVPQGVGEPLEASERYPNTAVVWCR
jgi:hypothetical protein